MDKLLQKWIEFRESEQGQGLVEYALIIALVAIVLVASLVLLQGKMSNVFSTISANL